MSPGVLRPSLRARCGTGGTMGRSHAALALGLAALLFASGCAQLQDVDWMGHRHELERTQKRYTHFVRWGEFEQASQSVPPADRGAYLEAMRAFGDLRFTDYETMTPVYGPDGREASVEVVYHAYSPRTLQEQTYREVQEWRLGEGGMWVLEAKQPPLAPAREVGAR